MTDYDICLFCDMRLAIYDRNGRRLGARPSTTPAAPQLGSVDYFRHLVTDGGNVPLDGRNANKLFNKKGANNVHIREVDIMRRSKTSADGFVSYRQFRTSDGSDSAYDSNDSSTKSEMPPPPPPVTGGDVSAGRYYAHVGGGGNATVNKSKSSVLKHRSRRVHPTKQSSAGVDTTRQQQYLATVTVDSLSSHAGGDMLLHRARTEGEFRPAAMARTGGRSSDNTTIRRSRRRGVVDANKAGLTRARQAPSLLPHHHRTVNGTLMDGGSPAGHYVNKNVNNKNNNNTDSTSNRNALFTKSGFDQTPVVCTCGATPNNQRQRRRSDVSVGDGGGRASVTRRRGSSGSLAGGSTPTCQCRQADGRKAISLKRRNARLLIKGVFNVARYLVRTNRLTRLLGRPGVARKPSQVRSYGR